MTKLCPRGKRAAQRKFKVYPSAYANAYASKICAGKIKDPSGVKRKDFRGPKPAKKGMMIMIAVGKPKKKMLGGMTAGAQSGMGRLQKAAMMNKGGGADYMNTVKAKPRGNPAVVGKKRVSLKEKNKLSKGAIMSVANKLEKASKAHAGQAKTLKSIKVRGGGMAMQGMNFKGVY
tara:strand:+ start:17 stop:541 length:525 start_codon:yes stop_codon:yes gene_type:complete